MRKILCLLVSGLLAQVSFAQKGFYIAPSFGAGMANTSKSLYGEGAGSTISKSTVVSYNAQIGVGYRYKNWRFETGVQLFSSGYQLNNLLLSSDFDPNATLSIGMGKYQARYNHIGIPLQAGYACKVSKKFNVVYSLGLITSYNLGVSTWIKDSKTEVTTRMSGEDFKKNYNTLSFWGKAGIHPEYQLNNRISIFAGPSLFYMISDFGKTPDNGTSKATQRNFNINLDAGFKLNF